MSERVLEKVLVRFPGDNDFHIIMEEFGHILLRFEKNSNRHWGTQDYTKSEVVEFFNAVAEPICSFFLGKSPYHTSKYLIIGEKDIFINGEVDVKMESYFSWGNGDSVLIDYWNGTVTVV
jgi:hypothetical protein